MKRIKNFVISAFLSGMCLIFSVPVFAGNVQNTNKITIKGVLLKLNFVQRKVLFESTEQILNELDLILVVLKNIEKRISFEEKSLISKQFVKILDNIKIANHRDEKCDILLREAVYMGSPHAPKILPIEFKMYDEIEEIRI